MKWLPWVTAAVVGVAAFLGGRYLAPPEVRTETRVEYKDRVIEKRVEVQGATVEKIRVVTKTVWATPDAGTVTRECDLTGSREQVLAVTSTMRDESREGSQMVVSTPVLPRYSLGVQFGAAWERPWLAISGPMVLGLEAKMRVVGPLWAGVWVSTYGAAGGSLAVTW